MAAALDTERILRFALWGQLQAGAGPDSVPPSRLTEMRLYKGQRGIWVDKERTGDLAHDGRGITVAIAHTGTAYDDDLSEDGIIYRYPLTGMSTRDDREVGATKNASRFGLPIFVIAASPTRSALRKVRLGWVSDWDDRSGQFLVEFGEEPHRSPAIDETPFALTQSRQRKLSLLARRSGQARFHFDVMSRYGPSCAVCSIDVRDVLDTPHLVPVASRGSNDPRNGLVMCATHHRAFDAHLFGIRPDSLKLSYLQGGPGAERLRIGVDDLRALERHPHPEALSWRWDYWHKKAPKVPDRQWTEAALAYASL